MDVSVVEKYAHLLAFGALTTIKIVLISFLIGAVIALPLALIAANKRFPFLRMLANGYILFFRGTPLLGQLFFVYYGSAQIRSALAAVGLWQFFRDPYFCAYLVLSLNTAAYQAEIMRGALLSVAQGQREGAKALSLPPLVVLFWIILPQALIVAIRPFGNEFILLLKSSSLLSVITVQELMLATKHAFSASFSFQIYAMTACIYLVIVMLATAIFRHVENRLLKYR